MYIHEVEVQLLEMTGLDNSQSLHHKLSTPAYIMIQFYCASN